MKLIIVLLFGLLSISCVAQEKLKGVFVSRLDSLLLEERFNSDFRQWVKTNAINTVFVYNPYLVADKQFQTSFKEFMQSNPEVSWVAVVSSPEGYAELFTRGRGNWTGFMLEYEWWWEQGGFRKYKQSLSKCKRIDGLKHYVYLGWLSTNSFRAKRQAKKIASLSDVVLLHCYTKVLYPEYVSERLLLFTRHIKTALIYSLQPEYSYDDFYGKNYTEEHQRFVEHLKDFTGNDLEKMHGYVIFTYLDAIE